MATEAQRRPRARKSIAHLPSPDENQPELDKENSGNNITTAFEFAPLLKQNKSGSRRGRSKSLGPGGLDGLRNDAGNRQKLATAVTPKSILKPTISLSPLRPIPARKAVQTSQTNKSPSRSPSKTGIQMQQNNDMQLLGESSGLSPTLYVTVGAPRLAPSEQQPQAATQTDSERAQEERRKSREEAIKQRDLRRKSLANRRVSFAPEATLHTWDMIEEMQDSTTSSAATSQSRRASGMSTSADESPETQKSAGSGSIIEEPSTPPAEARNATIQQSPTTPENLPETRHFRRMSGTPQASFLDVDTKPSSSPSSEASVSMDLTAPLTQLYNAQPVGSPIQKSSGQIATNEQSIHKRHTISQRTMSRSALSIEASARLLAPTLREEVNPFSPAFKGGLGDNGRGINDTRELSMDISRAVGSIVVHSDSQPSKTTFASRRQSMRERRMSSASNAEETMEFTTAIGGINTVADQLIDSSLIDRNEELSMELTSVFHAPNPSVILPQPQNSGSYPIDRKDVVDDVDMEMTVPLGSIVHNSHFVFEPEDEDIQDMDMTNAIGSIFNSSDVRGNAASPLNSASLITPTISELLPADGRPLHDVMETNNVTNQVSMPPIAKVDHSPSVQPKRASRLSGRAFVDANNLGSPRVTAILDRRRSLSQSPVRNGLGFSRRIQFEDPPRLAKQATVDWAEDVFPTDRSSIHERVTGAKVDADVEDNTSTLKDAINSMTPKKRKLGGRKSLAVGAAKGILGTRPTELDESDDDMTASRLMQGSPAKRMKFQHASEAFGLPRLKNTPKLDAWSASIPNLTPKKQMFLKSAESDFSGRKSPLPTVPKNDHPDDVISSEQEVAENIHLSAFLELANLRFIEISTTKRRHTVLPNTKTGEILTSNDQEDLAQVKEELVVAGSCTVPLLELYQHSCRELRKYISEGRNVVQEIEKETFADNPPLFQKYLSALPTERVTMDNRFRVMKAHARLISKGMWYEWRMKLLEGLKAGLDEHAQGLLCDDEALVRQEQMLLQLTPSLLSEYDSLEAECMKLQASINETASYDHEEATALKEEIAMLDEDLQRKSLTLADFQGQLEGVKNLFVKEQEQKSACMHAIEHIERVKEESRLWSAAEVAELRSAVGKLRTKHGWSVTTAGHGSITMTYRDQLALFFNPAAFFDSTATTATARQRLNSPISLTYIESALGKQSEPLTTEKRFFLQLMRAHLQCLMQQETNVPSLLQFVSDGWDRALAVANEVKSLEQAFITRCSILDDERLAIRASVLLPTVETKVCATFVLSAIGRGMDVEAELAVGAEVVYGEKYKEDRMGDFLKSKIGGGLAERSGAWVGALNELRRRLIAQGRKQ